MYVIGTSGHIDHGKTSLILALTGIDCDRLPEEKLRQMTIDIGFACIEVPEFGIVSVVDVPGHERFIRNMVTGAWGIDLGLLVVAADDGWMPQTEDHFRVLELLSVERIIVAVTKIDIAGEAAQAGVEQSVRGRLAGSAYGDADIVRVSARTGSGIDALKSVIAANLAKLSRVRDTGKPFMYIDRVFASHGHGTVVTGTLKNGTLAENDPVYIQPGGREARIKRIESHFSAQGRGNPSQRTALNLSGVTADALKRGHIIYKKNFLSASTEIIARIRLLDANREIKNNINVEILVGAAGIKGKIILLADIRDHSLFFARIKFENPVYCYPYQPFVLTNPGGFRIIGGGTVLFPWYAKKYKERVKQGLALFRSYSVEELIAFILTVFQWRKKQDLDSMLSQGAAEIDAVLAALQKQHAVLIVSGYVITRDTYEGITQSIGATIKNHPGLNIKEISSHVQADIELCRLIIPSVLKSNPIAEREGRFIWETAGVSENLPKDKKNVLNDALKKSTEGVELDKIKDESFKRNVRELITLGHLVSLDGNIIYHQQVYDDKKKAIMGLFESRDKISISDAREATGLSRKYLIPLLNRIEREGKIKRLGDFRIKT